jgi:hypothetical protein
VKYVRQTRNLEPQARVNVSVLSPEILGQAKKLQTQIGLDLYKNEYRIFKPVEAITKRDKVERRKIEKMNQFGFHISVYMWKCHKETPCRATLNKQKCANTVYTCM